MQISVGVIIPVYNRPDGAAAAVESVLKQSLQAAQIVLVDDCSQPPLSLPPSLGGDPRITIRRLKRNSGASAARGVGLESIGTTHVAFLDSDDIWAPTKLSRQVEIFESLGRPDMTAVSCGWNRLDARGASATRHPRPSAQLSDFVSGCWFCPGSTLLMAMSDIARIGGFDSALRRLEDLDLFIRFAKAGGRLEVVPSVEATIRRGRNATSQEVDGAAARLRARYSQTGDEPLASDLFRRLDAWLAVEEAAAARNERQFIRMASRFVYSLVKAPRLRKQLGDWWQ